jgi:hypothetical protein
MPIRQLDEGLGHLGMRGAKRLLADGEHPPIERAGGESKAQIERLRGKAHKLRDDLWAVGTEIILGADELPFPELQHPRVLAEVEERRQVFLAQRAARFPGENLLADRKRPAQVTVGLVLTPLGVERPGKRLQGERGSRVKRAEGPLGRCRPGRAKRRPVVRGRGRARTDCRSGAGDVVSRSRRRESVRASDTPSAICGRCGARQVFCRVRAATAGRPRHKISCRHCARPVGSRSPRQVSRALTRHPDRGHPHDSSV